MSFQAEAVHAEVVQAAVLCVQEPLPPGLQVRGGRQGRLRASLLSSSEGIAIYLSYLSYYAYLSTSSTYLPSYLFM